MLSWPPNLQTYFCSIYYALDISGSISQDGDDNFWAKLRQKCDRFLYIFLATQISNFYHGFYNALDISTP